VPIPRRDSISRPIALQAKTRALDHAIQGNCRNLWLKSSHLSKLESNPRSGPSWPVIKKSKTRIWCRAISFIGLGHKNFKNNFSFLSPEIWTQCSDSDAIDVSSNTGACGVRYHFLVSLPGKSLIQNTTDLYIHLKRPVSKYLNVWMHFMDLILLDLIVFDLICRT
jgi:hypothetical protein